jgi:hypothetical protein
METTLHALEQSGGTEEGSRIPIRWSEARRDHLRRVASNEIASLSAVDPALSIAMLLCADGRFAEAERTITELLRENLGACRQGGEICISFLNALFVVQRFDLVAALLRDRYGFDREMQIEARLDGPGSGRVRWDILATGTHRFTFDAKAYEEDNTRYAILAFQWEFPIYAYYAKLEDQETGSVIINQQDVGQTPGLAWCDNRPNYFLIPDCVFVPSEGYKIARQTFRDNRVPWTARTPVAFWRGATTGIPATHGNWRSLERVKLCELARRNSHTGLIDAGISSIVQFDAPDIVRQIRDSGLVRDPVQWCDWNRYKYLIDIDGNSSPWSSLFQRLLTASPVLKVESSRGMQQWFYDELIPWQNYVPIAPDMSDLMDKVAWLVRNDSVAEQIGCEGHALAEHLTYEREIRRGAAVISAAFRYFNQRPCEVGPFGRLRGDADSNL